MNPPNYNKYINYYIWFILFCPTFWGFMPETGKTIGQLFFSMSAIIFVGILLYKSGTYFKFPKIITFIFTIQCFLYVLSITLNSISFHSNISLKDFSDITRPILYAIAISIPISLNFKESQLKNTIATFITAILACLIMDIIKFFPLGTIILKLYTALSPDSFNYIRLSGTFSYCYNFGFVLIFPMFYCLYVFRHKLRNLIFFLILLILTGSRSILLATAITLIIYHFSSDSKFHSKLTKAIIFTITIIVLLWFLSLIEIPIIQSIFTNFERLIDALSGEGNDGSLSTRSNQLNNVISNFNKSPIWGNGPLKSTTAPIEMQIGYHLSAWGIIGVTLLLTIYTCCFYWALKLRNNPNHIVRAFSRTNLLWLIASLIVGMSTPITDQIRVFQIFYLLQGIQYTLYRKSQIKSKYCLHT